MSSLALKAALDIGYYQFVAPVFAYAGFKRYFLLDRLLLSYAVTTMFALAVSRVAHYRRPSSIGLIVLFGMLFIPLLTYWALSNASNSAMLIYAIGFGMTILTTSLAFRPLTSISVNPTIPLSFAILIGITTFGTLLAKGGVHFANISFAEVYDFRNEVYSHIITGFVGYLVPWYGKCAGIFLMSYAAWRRNWIAFTSLAIAQVLLFSLTSNKEYAFYPLIILFLVRAERSTKTGVTIIALFAVLATIGTFAYLIFGNIATPAILLMRTFLVQALNSFQYYDFFQSHQLLYWSNSFLSKISAYSYDRPIPEIIGAGRYGAGSEAFANTGYLGSGFMQLGVVGVLIYGVAAGIMLRLFDVILGRNSPLQIGGAMAFVVATQLVNADLTIVFVSCGVILAYLLLFLSRRHLEGRYRSHSAIEYLAHNP